MPENFPTEEELESYSVNPSVQRPSLVPTSERDMIKRYTRVFRGAHSAVLNMFKDTRVLADNGELIAVPIKFGLPERALAALFATAPSGEDGAVRRQKLPLGVLTPGAIEFDQSRFTYHQALRRGAGGFRSERSQDDALISISRGIPVNIAYTLLFWTKYLEDIYQIVEQTMIRFSPCATLHIAGTGWESPLWLEGSASNIEQEGGEDRPRIVKWEFTLRLETYVPQPLRRNLTVKKVRTDIALGTTDEDPAFYESVGEVEVDLPDEWPYDSSDVSSPL